MTTASRGGIQRLDQNVADAIAAGEVIERPASVVKELCENALDAGATRIDITTEGGGLVRIAVADDGRGIARDDLPLALARHATSKISVIDDLAGVTSLGFRGEALASIAAVADVEITSARDGAAARLHARGGTLDETVTAARDTGTTIEVRDLFFNTPARLRFLKTERGETAAIGRMVSDLALSHPDVAFTLNSDGRRSVRTSGTTLRDAAGAIFGADATRELMDMSSPGTVTVTGCISQPRAHRGSRAGLILVINRRRVHNRSLIVAIEDAYRGVMPLGRHPYGVVSIEIDPTEVDVNVHPTKREVKLREEGRVYAAVQRACWTTLQDASAFTGAVSWTATASHAELAPVLELGDAEPASAFATGPVTEQRPTETPADVLAGLVPLGQAGNEWLVAAAPGRVVLIDPHAAHEKVLYEEILARWENSGPSPDTAGQVQLLLIPAIVECDAAQMETFAARGDWLRGCGFDVEEFGPTTLRCSAVPAESSDADTERLVRDVLDTLAAPHDDTARRHAVAALVACHSAVRFGDSLGAAEQTRLLERLAATPNAITCPHGRPTVMVLSDTTLRRAFGRPPV